MIDIDKVTYLLEEKLEELTEAQLEYLLENRIEFIKNAVKDKLSTDHDPESAKLSSDKIVDHIASKIDPTTNKSHTQWLVNRYKAGDFKLGDAKELKKTMSSYENVKKHLESADLNSMKSIRHLKDSIATTRSKVAALEKDLSESAVDDRYKSYRRGEPRIVKMSDKGCEWYINHREVAAALYYDAFIVKMVLLS